MGGGLRKGSAGRRYCFDRCIIISLDGKVKHFPFEIEAVILISGHC